MKALPWMAQCAHHSGYQLSQTCGIEVLGYTGSWRKNLGSTALPGVNHLVSVDVPQTSVCLATFSILATGLGNPAVM